jgi:competence protein ComEA
MRAPSLLLSFAFALTTGFPLLASAVEAPASPTKSTAVQAVQVPSETVSVNLNTADAEMLQNGLIGIGAVKAHAIVEYRDTHGPFASVDELLEVKGIGAATLDKNRARLSLK